MPSFPTTSRSAGSRPCSNLARQMAAVEVALGDRFRCYLGMRHSAPWIEEVVGEMVRDGVTRAVSLVLAPHFSKLSVGRYQAKIADGLRMARGSIEFAHIESYHTAPKLIQAFADRIGRALRNWAEEERASVHVVFSAHSLPAQIIESGDPYDSQVRETARLVAAKLGLPSERWSWSYQSAGRTPEPWLGPQLYEHLPKLAERGIRNVLSVPIGFVSDHVEILFDVDIQAQAAARRSRHAARAAAGAERRPAVRLLAGRSDHRACSIGRVAAWRLTPNGRPPCSKKRSAACPAASNSPVRSFRAVGGQPRFIARGAGSHLWDVDGNEFIDYVMSWGPLILGHANPPRRRCDPSSRREWHELRRPMFIGSRVGAARASGDATLGTRCTRQFRHRSDDERSATGAGVHRKT